MFYLLLGSCLPGFYQYAVVSIFSLFINAITHNGSRAFSEKREDRLCGVS
jgi:hypothetical protein